MLEADELEATAEASTTATPLPRWVSNFKRAWDSPEKTENQQYCDSHRSLTRAHRDRLKGPSTEHSILARNMFRYVYFIVDLSFIVPFKYSTISPEGDEEADALEAQECIEIAERLLVIEKAVIKFISEFFEQNPISILGIIALKHDRSAFMISSIHEPKDSASLIEEYLAYMKAYVDATMMEIRTRNSGLHTTESVAKNGPSLLSGISLALKGLNAQKIPAPREVIVFYSSIFTLDDPKVSANFYTQKDDQKVLTFPPHISLSVISTKPPCHLITQLCRLSTGSCRVALDEKDISYLLVKQSLPSHVEDPNQPAALIPQGFPESLEDPTDPKTTGFICPRCEATVPGLPARCAVCGLNLVTNNALTRLSRHIHVIPKFVYHSEHRSTSAEYWHLKANNNGAVGTYWEEAKKRGPCSGEIVECAGCFTKLLKQDTVHCAACLGIYCPTCEVVIQDQLFHCPTCP